MCKRSSTGPMTMASLGHLLAWQVTAANAPARAQVECLTGQVQDVTGESVVWIVMAQGDTGVQPLQGAATHDIQHARGTLTEAM
jgi:hypothetical protein